MFKLIKLKQVVSVFDFTIVSNKEREPASRPVVQQLNNCF